MSCNKSLFHRNLYSIFQVIPERLLYILRNNVYVILCAICDFLHVCFSRFLNYTNGTKSRNAPHMDFYMLYLKDNLKVCMEKG